MVLENKIFLNNIECIFIEVEENDYRGVRLVVESFIQDMKNVFNKIPMIIENISQSEKLILIVCDINSDVAKNNNIDISDLEDKRECYKIDILNNKDSNERSIFIIGSDKRGTIYGIYHLSELIGVSPWYYMADVAIEKKNKFGILEKDLKIISKEPSVKYRGIFLNDEWPSLGTWVSKTFGDFNEKFYNNVFELILRLKGNFLWPAMWSAVFSEDGEEENIANIKLANDYGIVMGTSHHEPMFRAGEEWKKINENYGNNSSWDFRKNEDAISNFWEDGLLRNKDFESLITIGMRGEQDSALEGSDEENIKLLKRIIKKQKNLLNKYDMNDIPKVLTVYKEIEKYWYGTDKEEGLINYELLDDVIIMLSDDNFGNVKNLPNKEELRSKAGWGMYYHFDYHGGPTSYEWVNTTQIEKIWEQMSIVYDYGIRDIWVVNVGDLKPMEFPISYFLDLAYDFDTYGKNGLNKYKEYTTNWSKKQFPKCNNTLISDISEILNEYTKLNSIRKPEVISKDTYNTVNYNEAEEMLKRVFLLEEKINSSYKAINNEYIDSFYQLVYYPAMASINIIRMQIYAGYNSLYYSRGSALANYYGNLVEECKSKDISMEKYYNNDMANGKWFGMMSSPHIGYTNWNADNWSYPEIKYINLKDESIMIINLQEDGTTYYNGEATLKEFIDIENEDYFINISNGGNIGFSYEVEKSNDWIVVDKINGKIKYGEKIKVSIEWSKIEKNESGYIKILGAGKEVLINISAKKIDISKLDSMTFVENNSIVAIEAEHYSKAVNKDNDKWINIDNYGKYLSAMKIDKSKLNIEKLEDAPYLEYLLNLNEDEVYNISLYTSPSNSLIRNNNLRLGISINDDEIVTLETLPRSFIAGDYNNEEWCKGVLDNIRITKLLYKMKKGLNKVKIYYIDAGVVLERIVVSKDPLKESFLGPKESYYKS